MSPVAPKMVESLTLMILSRERNFARLPYDPSMSPASMTPPSKTRPRIDVPVVTGYLIFSKERNK